MFSKPDNTFNEIREKSLLQWLSEMENHDDIAVRGGVQLAKDYFSYLKNENEKLKSTNKLKDEYLKKIKDKNNKLPVY